MFSADGEGDGIWGLLAGEMGSVLNNFCSGKKVVTHITQDLVSSREC